MLSRRGLIGSLLAAPVIIRTPGLLMPIKPIRKLPLVMYIKNSQAVRLPDYYIADAGPYEIHGSVWSGDHTITVRFSKSEWTTVPPSSFIEWGK